MEKRTLNIKQGGIYWIDSEPHAGREEGGHSSDQHNIRRPVVVVSNNRYNRTELALVFPITSNLNSNSRYLLPVNLKKPSAIILTQVLGYDMEARNAEYSGVKISDENLDYLKEILIHMI